MYITVSGIEIELIRKSIKNMHLYVLRPDGKVRITAPKTLSEKRIIEFVESRAEWILKQREKIDAEPKKPEITYSSGDILTIFGKPYALEIVEGKKSSSFQLKKMKTRWGTCNTRTKKIWLNFELCRKSDECIEYVILHELTHLKVPNHGKDFSDFMDRYMPYWREIRMTLNER